MVRWHVLGYIVLLQGICAIIAVFYKTDFLTDLSYGGTFALLIVFLLLHYGDSIPDYMIFLLIFLWGVRLACYLFIRILVLKKDARFDGVREQPRSFAKFWLLQSITIFLLMVGPVLVFQKSGLTLTFISIVGLLIALGGLCIETIADRQKFTYKRQYPSHRVDTGMRSKAKHPNYFGEMLMWWGLFIGMIPYLSGWEYIAVVGPFSITWLLLFITGIPPLQAQREKKYGDDGNFQQWKKTTRLLVPM